ncbi:hypothetical protein TH53_07445 [Pedobacter lusitanus]|uniref:Peptidase metallopeptidase domain-containing protein n=1 Tax=Pedobacter lusitanus TaxID=1503925 RepID=A0A0D0GTI3_9SPHI|nr:M12 family metallopeptidase [Pedobacter lusitanus]KIO77756.1 hypothetical protein TH53_07445 [Pedobacter lusitanus]
MKRKFELLAIVLIVICFVACKKEKQPAEGIGSKTTTDGAISGVNAQWPQNSNIKIAFLNGTQEQQDYVKEAVKVWQDQINVSLVFQNSLGGSDVRISFDSSTGSGWSYVGYKDNKGIKDTLKATMALFKTLGSKEKNGEPVGTYHLATVRHEFGHMLGLIHEQLRADSDVKWNDQLNIGGRPIDSTSFAQYIKSPYDKKSIMHYSVSAKYTKDSIAIPGYLYDLKGELSQTDKDFISSIYPR